MPSLEQAQFDRKIDKELVKSSALPSHFFRNFRGAVSSTDLARLVALGDDQGNPA